MCESTLEAVVQRWGSLKREGHRPEWLGIVSLLLLVALLPLVGAAEAGALRKSYEATFAARPLSQLLQPSAMLSCQSDLADSTGYDPKDWQARLDPQQKTEFRLRSAFEKQSQTGWWKISLKGDEAVVSGDQTGETSYQIVRWDSWSLILTHVGHGALGARVEVITIDPLTGSFVSASSSVGPLWNRTTTWVGRCS